MLLYIVWGVQKTQNLTKEYTYRVRTLIWPFYFNLDHCVVCSIEIKCMNRLNEVIEKTDTA